MMHDNSAYQVYYEVLTGQRKAGRGLIASEKSILTDPSKMARLGFEEGIGFIPFAGIGWRAIKTIAKDDSSPVRAAAAKVLAKDPDPAVTTALAEVVFDESWLGRVAALEALAKRGNPSVLDPVELAMSDEKDAVKYTAAAAVLRLMAIKESGAVIERKRKGNEKDGEMWCGENIARTLPGVVKRLRLRRCEMSRSGYCFVEHEKQAGEQHQQRGESDPRAFNTGTAWEDHPLIFCSEVASAQYSELGIVSRNTVEINTH